MCIHKQNMLNKNPLDGWNIKSFLTQIRKGIYASKDVLHAKSNKSFASYDSSGHYYKTRLYLQFFLTYAPLDCILWLFLSRKWLRKSGCAKSVKAWQKSCWAFSRRSGQKVGNGFIENFCHFCLHNTFSWQLEFCRASALLHKSKRFWKLSTIIRKFVFSYACYQKLGIHFSHLLCFLLVQFECTRARQAIPPLARTKLLLISCFMCLFWELYAAL